MLLICLTNILCPSTRIFLFANNANFLFYLNMNHTNCTVCFFAGSFLDSSSALLAVAACTALGEIGRNGPLLIPAEGEGFTKLSMVENLLARIPSGKESTKVT